MACYAVRQRARTHLHTDSERHLLKLTHRLADIQERNSVHRAKQSDVGAFLMPTVQCSVCELCECSAQSQPPGRRGFTRQLRFAGRGLSCARAGRGGPSCGRYCVARANKQQAFGREHRRTRGGVTTETPAGEAAAASLARTSLARSAPSGGWRALLLEPALGGPSGAQRWPGAAAEGAVGRREWGCRRGSGRGKANARGARSRGQRCALHLLRNKTPASQLASLPARRRAQERWGGRQAGWLGP